MVDKVKKPMVEGMYAIGRNESWLMDMARQGLHLEKFGSMFAVFEKGEPKETQYRIDVFYDAPSQDCLEIYETSGWKYVTHTMEFYVFSSDTGAYMGEIYNEPREQGETLATITRKMRKSVIIMIIAVCAVVALYSSIYIFSDEPVLQTIKAGFLNQIFIVVLELFVLFKMLSQYRELKKIRRCLLENIPINHNEPYKGRRRVKIIIGVLSPIIFVIVMTFSIVEITSSKKTNITAEALAVPVARLADIENNSAMVKDKQDTFDDSGIDYNNFIKYEMSILAPVQCKVKESGLVKGTAWADGSGEYSPSISTEYYELRFAKMGNAVAKDLANKYAWRYNQTRWESAQDDGVDYKYCASGDSWVLIVAVRGNEVVCTRYYGNADGEKVAEEVVKALNRDMD